MRSSKKTTRHSKNILLTKSKKVKKIKDNLGFHIGIAEGVLTGIKYAFEECGVRSMQMFAGSNRSASLKTKTKLTEDEMQEIKDYVMKNKINLFIHAVYVINLCAYHASSRRSHYIHENILYDMNLANKIGARGVIVHLGSSTNLTIPVAITNLASNLNTILSKMDDELPAKLILETSSGQGSQVGLSLEDFRDIYHLIEDKYRDLVGICIDTSHIFASGVEIRNLEVMKDYMKKAEKYFKPSKIVLVHLNDNPKKLGSRRDLHEIVGKGEIFESVRSKMALKWLLDWCEKKKVCVVLETSGAGYPGSSYCEQIEDLRK